MVWTIRKGKERKRGKAKGKEGKEGKEKVINFRSLQAILIRISSFAFDAGQTDRQTDRHDVTLEATPSKYFDGGLKNALCHFLSS